MNSTGEEKSTLSPEEIQEMLDKVKIHQQIIYFELGLRKGWATRKI